MTEHEHDARVIEATSRAVQRPARPAGRPDRRPRPTSGSSSTAQPTPFEPGQYMTIGVFADGKLVQRPYSVASPPVEAGRRRLRVLRPARADPALHDAAVAPAHRAPDADDRAEGQVPARARRPPDPPVRVDRDRDRAVHLDDPPEPGRRRAAEDGRPPRLLVRRGARLPRRARGLGARRTAIRSATSRRSRGRTTRATPAGPGGPAGPRRSSARSARTSACARTGRSSTSAATPT